MTETVTIVDLIRHGEPVGGSKYRGHIDDPLSEKGWKQMRDAVEGHSPWNSIISSPLSRCSAFAHEMGEKHGLDVREDERLKEIGFGDWEGKTKDQISAESPTALSSFYDDPITNRPPGAETLAGFNARIGEAWNDLVNQYAGQHVLLVGHAGVIRMTLLHILDMPLNSMFRIYVPNAGITRIRVDGVGEKSLTSLMFHAGKL